MTLAAVRAFQTAHNLASNGVVAATTWQALLQYAPAKVLWTNAGAKIPRAAGYRLAMPVPKSAGLRAKRDEIPGSLGAGAPPRR